MCWSLFLDSRSQMFFKIVVLKNFANFTGKRLRWILFQKIDRASELQLY